MTRLKLMSRWITITTSIKEVDIIDGTSHLNLNGSCFNNRIQGFLIRATFISLQLIFDLVDLYQYNFHTSLALSYGNP